MNFLTTTIIPPWVKYAAIALAALALYAFGRFDGTRIEGAKHQEYIAAQATKALRITKAQQKVVIQTEIEYRDRIKTIYVKGDVIEKKVPVYVTQADNDRCIIPSGFVRLYDAAWAGDPPGPATDSDRGPAGIPLSIVAETDAYNATSCRAWREQALGWREFYGTLKAATDGK